MYSTAHAAGETSPDYENVYDDDDASRSPGNLAKSTATPMVPYFDQKTAVIYVQPNATNVKLDCPVKNYDGKFKTLGVCPSWALIVIYRAPYAFSYTPCDTLVPGQAARREWQPVDHQHLQSGQPVRPECAAGQRDWPQVRM